MNPFEKALSGQKVIAALRRIEDLHEILNHQQLKTIFILNCNIFQLKGIKQEGEKYNKNIFVHIDLVEGLGKDGAGVRYLAKSVGVTGIISTKTPLIRAAKEEGLVAVQRFFMVDSEAVKTGLKVAKKEKPHAIEIMPAYLPKYYLDELDNQLGLPMIAGGLIRDIKDAEQVLALGFQAITTSRRALWSLK